MAKEKDEVESIYLNESKLERAQAVVAGSRKFADDSVEATSLAVCKAKSDSKVSLLDCVYERIGGAYRASAQKAPLEVGIIDSKTEGKEVTEIPKPGRGRKAK